MIRIDMRFNQDVMHSLIGKTLEKYRCDRFVFTNSVTQRVGFYIDGEVYNMTNCQESIDYFGQTDDVAVSRFEKTTTDDIKSAFADVEQIDTPIGAPIEEIRLINENQRISVDGECTYDVWLTRAIIFVVDGREILFEKDVIPFSEEIIILKGYDLEEQVSDEKGFSEGWEAGIVPECHRSTIVINSDSYRSIH